MKTKPAHLKNESADQSGYQGVHVRRDKKQLHQATVELLQEDGILPDFEGQRCSFCGGGELGPAKTLKYKAGVVHRCASRLASQNIRNLSNTAEIVPLEISIHKKHHLAEIVPTQPDLINGYVKKNRR